MTAKTAAKTTTTRKGGIGNTPASTGPVVPANLAGVVTEPTTPAPAKKVTAAELKATMDAKTAANAAKKAAAKTAAPKTQTATQAAAKAARDAAKEKTAAEVLAWLTARAGTCFSVKEVEIGTGNGPTSDGVKTLRPTLWALVEKGLVIGHSDTAPLKNESGHKGFMVKAAAAPRKAAAKKTTTSK